MDNLIIFFVLLAFVILSSLCAVLFRSLIKAAIALALSSALLAAVLFVLGAWLAGVFELSVCAGLITVIFVSTIGLTKPLLTEEEEIIEAKNRMKRFVYLPFILVIAVGVLYFFWNKGLISFNFGGVAVNSPFSLQDVMWDRRQLDILGQIIVIISGVFGVVVLFKEEKVR
jgi:NADH-quinone oxidoreductase subunit J